MTLAVHRLKAAPGGDGQHGALLRPTITILAVASVTCWLACSPQPQANDNSDNNNDNSSGEPPAWYRPDASTTWQWQLQPGAAGTINTNYDVDLYDLDLFDVQQAVIDALQAEGRRVLCYFSAGSYEDFREDAGEFRPEELGNPLEGYPDERWLDIRAPNVRRIMLQRLDRAAQRGCDGVEPDNVMGFEIDLDPDAAGTGFNLSAADQLDFNRFLADSAHERGLAIALKNDLTQVTQLVEVFDLAVNEQCHEFDECDLLQPFLDADKPVLNAEYAGKYVQGAAAREKLCATARAAGLQTLILPVDLDDSFRFSCE